METSNLLEKYNSLLSNFYNTYFFGKASISYILNSLDFKESKIRQFYKEHALVLKDKIVASNYINVLKEEHPSICGGVTEYLTKIKLAIRLNISLDKLGFFDDVNRSKYNNLSDGELAFAMYEPDIFYRSGMRYDESIINDRTLIIKKAETLSNIALKLIDNEFPIIKTIDFHPDGYVFYNNALAIKGDSDLLINNCLIDFKTKKNSNISLNDRAQLFAYAINKFARDGKEYTKVFILNPRYNYLCELINN